MTRPLPFSNGQRAWSGLPRGEDIGVSATHDCGENVSTQLRHDEFPKVRASMNSGDEGGSQIFSLWSIGMYSMYSCVSSSHPFWSLPNKHKHLGILDRYTIYMYCFSNFNLYLPMTSYFPLRQVLEVAPSVRTSNRSSTPTLPLWMESTLWKFQWWFY